MSTSSPFPLAQRPTRDWLRGAVVWGILPGWLLSLCFHGAMLGTMITLTQMPSCRGDYSGEDGTGFREIGLRAREDSNNAPAAGPGEPGLDEVSANVQTTSSSAEFAAPTISDTPPVPLSLTDAGTAPAVMGIGPPPLSGMGGTPANTPGAATTINGGGTPGSRGGGGGEGNGLGQTSLFGVNDAGKTFVYVIDSSSSMDEHNAFRAAKAELMTSLSRLTEVQQFQVIFYNNVPAMLKTRDDRFRMFLGNDTQRLQASEQIASYSAIGGTQHLPAVLAALKLNPDVIFLLTDAASDLSRDEIETIKTRNRQGTRIHCIEFGKGAMAVSADGQPVPNFLMKLAAQNSGKYTYRNVTAFGKE